MELSTGFALVGLVMAVISATGAIISSRIALQLDQAERTVASALRAVKASGDRLSAIEGRLDRLAGRLYATTRKPPPVDYEPSDVPDLVDRGNGALDAELEAALALQNAAPVAPGLRK